MKIREVIVVEGKNDTNVLQQYFDCETIETHGTSMRRRLRSSAWPSSAGA